MSNRLNPAILQYLVKNTDLSINTIRKDISLLRRDYPRCTISAVAQIYARKRNLSVLRLLNQGDKETMPNFEMNTDKIIISKSRPKKKEHIVELIYFPTDNYYIIGHINEINRAYTKGCYTCTYVLARKIIENLILDLLRGKYPPTSRENVGLYFNIKENRIHDFGVLLKSLLAKKNDFGLGNNKIVERLYQKCKVFKDDANDKTHSWFHLVERRGEIDDLKIQSIIELIKELLKGN